MPSSCSLWMNTVSHKCMKQPWILQKRYVSSTPTGESNLFSSHFPTGQWQCAASRTVHPKKKGRTTIEPLLSPSLELPLNNLLATISKRGTPGKNSALEQNAQVVCVWDLQVQWKIFRTFEWCCNFQLLKSKNVIIRLLQGLVTGLSLNQVCWI